MEFQKELYDEGKKTLREYWFNLDFKKADGQSSGNVITIFKIGKKI